MLRPQTTGVLLISTITQNLFNRNSNGRCEHRRELWPAQP
jgi:hypothetical protein